jgi:hypothetical protein
VLVAGEDVVLGEPEAILFRVPSHSSSASRPSMVPAMGWSPGTCQTTSGAISDLTTPKSPERKASAVRR